MTIEVSEVKKAVVVSYDTNVVIGPHASIQAANPANDEVLEEKKNIANDGEAVLTFPLDYSGECVIVVRGSEAGEEDPVTISL